MKPSEILDQFENTNPIQLICLDSNIKVILDERFIDKIELKLKLEKLKNSCEELINILEEI
jgi:hypothetical protein